MYLLYTLIFEMKVHYVPGCVQTHELSPSASFSLSAKTQVNSTVSGKSLALQDGLELSNY